MKRMEILSFGFFLLSLALVTVAVKSRVHLLRRALAQELVLQRDLEAEALIWWQRIQSWRSPEGLARLAVIQAQRQGRRSAEP